MTIREKIEEAKQHELLTPEQFALLTQMHLKSIYRWISRDKIGVVRIGRAIRIPRSFVKVVRLQNPHVDRSLSPP